MTPAKLAELRRAAGGFRGRFFYDGERGDLAFVAERCEVGDCDCEQKLNSDGDQDCSVSIGDYHDDVFGEPIALMLNSVGALLDLVDAAHAPEAHWECQQRIDRLEEQLAAARWEGRIEGRDERIDYAVEIARLEEQLAAVTRARDELVDLLESRNAGNQIISLPQRITALRSVGKESGK